MNTEHTGAKNGGGHWGPRAEAKSRSRKARRRADKLVRYESPFASPVHCSPEQAARFAAGDVRAIRAMADLR